MTTTERIDAAIDTMPKIEEFDGRFANAVKLRDDVMFWYGENKETILEALRFQKAAMGEPSDAMIEAAETCDPMEHYPKSLHGTPTKKERCAGKWKAMIAELAKQVEGE